MNHVLRQASRPLCAALVLAPVLAVAQPAPPVFNPPHGPAMQVAAPEAPTLSLNAEVRESVAPDLMRVRLAVERSGKDLGPANSQVLQQANATLKNLKATAPSVQTSIQQVMTIPVYSEKGRPSGWRVRAELVLESADFDKLSVAAGQLATQMEMVSLDFVLSGKKRREMQNTMRVRLGAEFQEKARATAQALGYRGAQVRSVSLQEDEGEMPGRPMARGMVMMAAESAPAIPTEAAKTEVVVRMHGSVELLR